MLGVCPGGGGWGCLSFDLTGTLARLPPPQALRFSRKAGEGGELEARETGDEHAIDHPFPSSLARPPLSQQERRLGTRQLARD